MCPCGKAVESRTHIVGECDLYKEDRDVSQEMRKINECDMIKFRFGTLDSEKTIAIVGDRWWPQTARWPQTAKQEGDKISRRCLCNVSKNAMSARILEVSLLKV